MSVLLIPQVQQLLSISPAVIFNIVSKRDASKEATKINTGEEFEQTLVDLPVYVNNQLFIEKVTTLTWQHIKDTFAK